MKVDSWKNFALNQYSSPCEEAMQGVRIVFLMASSGISGGANIILNHAHALALAGAHVTVCFETLTPKEKENLIIWRSDLSSLRMCSLHELGSQKFDLAVATYWTTVFLLKSVKSSRYVYFVQSLETRFFRNHSAQDIDYLERSVARCAATYAAGFPVITVATWLQNFLQSQSRSQVWIVRNGVKKELFNSSMKIGREHRTDKRFTVMIEGNHDTPMKANRETLTFLNQEQFAEMRIILVTPTPVAKTYLTRSNLEVRSQVPLSDMGMIYGDCDVLVKMSRVEGMFGPPLEAFHVGTTAIVSRVTGYDEYVQNGINSIVVEIDDFDSMGQSILELAYDHALLQELECGALSTAKFWPDTDQSGRSFVAACYSILNSTHSSEDALMRLNEYEQRTRTQYSRGDLPDLLPFMVHAFE
jgi:hypothetical protein